METSSAQFSCEKRFDSRWLWLAVLGVILFVDVVRIGALQFPLERDEGEYAYAGQLLLHGIPPYKLAYNMKLPGTYLAYAAIIAAFGETAGAIHLGLLLLNAATIVLVFVLGRRLFGALTGLVACATYALTSLSPGVFGTAAHATHFVVFFALAGMIVLLRAVENGRTKNYFFSGLLLGTAFLMKQQGIFFGVFSFVYLLYREIRTPPLNWRQLGWRASTFGAGAIIPFVLTCIVLFWCGVFPKFWFWTFTYSRIYATTVPLPEASSYFSEYYNKYAGPERIFWAIGLAGLIWLCCRKTSRACLPFMLGLLLASIAAVAAGFYFRPHYFVSALPVLALLVGVAVKDTGDFLSAFRFGQYLRAAPVGIILLALFYFAAKEVSFFRFDLRSQIQFTYGGNPLVESREVGRYIRENSLPDARVAVIGSEPEIYFYSNRRSATGFIYTYALMETHPFARQMQLDMIREIEDARPEFLVLVNFQFSWLMNAGSDKTLFVWAEKYWSEFYETVGVVDVFEQETRYVWGDAAKTCIPQSSANILVFRRK